MGIEKIGDNVYDLLSDTFNVEVSNEKDDITINDLYQEACLNSWSFYIRGEQNTFSFKKECYLAPKSFLFTLLVIEINKKFWEIIDVLELKKIQENNYKVIEIIDLIFLKLKKLEL